MICTSHGVIWRDNPLQIVEQYVKWANDYQENQITILYDTMWNGTRKMAETIVAGIKTADPQLVVKTYNTSHRDKNDLITEFFKSKAILVGAPTVNRGTLSSLAGIMEEIKGLAFHNKKAAALGTYGWSGESVKVITKLLKESGFDIVNDGIKAMWNPDDAAVKASNEFERNFAEVVQNKASSKGDI